MPFSIVDAKTSTNYQLSAENCTVWDSNCGSIDADYRAYDKNHDTGIHKGWDIIF